MVKRQTHTTYSGCMILSTYYELDNELGPFRYTHKVKLSALSLSWTNLNILNDKISSKLI